MTEILRTAQRLIGSADTRPGPRLRGMQEVVMESGAKDDMAVPFETWAGRWHLSCLRQTYGKPVS